MPRVEKKESAAPVVGMVVVILAILGLGFWFLAQTPPSRAKAAVASGPDTASSSDRGNAPTPGASSGTRRRGSGSDPSTSSGMGAGMIAEAPMFEGRDIHDVPLGEILDHAQRLPYDEARGHEEVLGTNNRGQTVRVKLWPHSGASSLESPALRQGRIVARIQSDHAYEKLGLADGLNYLWVEESEAGGYQGVIIPATAFSPIFDLDRISITERTPKGVPLEKGAYWVNGGPWIGCGRC